MPPQAESNLLIAEEGEPVQQQRNVTFAINYQVSLVDEFVSAPPRRKRASLVETVPQPTEPNPNSQTTLFFNTAHPNSENNTPNSNNNSAAATPNRRGVLEKTRRSNRGKQGKREISLSRTRVRYDMQNVPLAEKNADFLQSFDKWWLQQRQQQPPSNNNIRASTPLVVPRRSTRLSETASTTASKDVREIQCHSCNPRSPFLNDSSLVWIPAKRSEWEDSISEMTAVCTSAARRTSHFVPDQKTPKPLSREYISDRVDIDDPVNGFQIRHSLGGWMQGFIMWTNFTTWTLFFKWDSLHPAAGMTGNGTISDRIDRDGSLAQKLESLPRSGDPLVTGTIFEAVAEIGLVGGLGCGEYLLRMALDDIVAQQKYKFVVLQATDSSRGFYEKFGFVRVGAICRYQKSGSGASGQSKKKPKASNVASPSSCVPEEREPDSAQSTAEPDEPPIVGYRHWTHANESETSLQMHGGPSYMMCLELPSMEELEPHSESTPVCSSCSQPLDQRIPPNTFLDAVLNSCGVENKPVVEQLNSSTTTPGLMTRLLQRRASTMSANSGTSPLVRKRLVRTPKLAPPAPSLPPPLVSVVTDISAPVPTESSPAAASKLSPIVDTTEEREAEVQPSPKPAMRKENHAKRQKLEDVNQNNNHDDSDIQRGTHSSSNIADTPERVLSPTEQEPARIDESEQPSRGRDVMVVETHVEESVAETVAEKICAEIVGNNNNDGVMVVETDEGQPSEGTKDLTTVSLAVISDEPADQQAAHKSESVDTASAGLADQNPAESPMKRRDHSESLAADPKEHSKGGDSVMQATAEEEEPIGGDTKADPKGLSEGGDTVMQAAAEEEEPNGGDTKADPKGLSEGGDTVMQATAEEEEPNGGDTKADPKEHSEGHSEGGDTVMQTTAEEEDMQATAEEEEPNGDSKADDNSPAATTTEENAPVEREENAPVERKIPVETMTPHKETGTKQSSKKKHGRSSRKRSAADRNKEERTYYSVRGPDGRFMRVPIDAAADLKTFSTAKKARKSKPESSPLRATKLRDLPNRRESPRVAGVKAATPPSPPVRPSRKSATQTRKSSSTPNRKPKSLNAAELRKQKVRAYPRARPHFYNRVVKLIPKKGRQTREQATYYFVFEYNEETEEVRLIPMEARGTLMGKRQGRPRFQCCVGTTDENFVIGVAQDYEVVDATMVMKTPFVAQEAWDIEDDDDSDDE